MNKHITHSKKLVLKSKRLILRKLSLKDADDFVKNRKSKEIFKWTLTKAPFPYKKEDARSFIRGAQKRWREGIGYSFAIEYKGEVVGSIGLIILDKQNKQGKIGYWLGKSYWGKGIMTEALELVIHYAFDKLKLHRINAQCFEENVGSLKVLQKAGFKKEGVRREASYRYGKWQNIVLFGLTAND